MKTRIITASALLIGSAISLVSFTNKNEPSVYVEENNLEVSEGELLFKAKCSACHVISKPDDMSNLIAPPIMGVMMHVKNGIKEKNKIKKREKSIAFIVDYVQNPSADKSLLKPHAIEHFKIMPSQKENVTPTELTTIANYLYDTFPPKDLNHKGKNKKSCEGECSGSCKH